MESSAKEAAITVHKGQASDYLYSCRLGHAKDRWIRDRCRCANFEMHKCPETRDSLWHMGAEPYQVGI